MKVALYQMACAWEAATHNRDHVTAWIDGLTEHPDLVVLPEMFSTGFSMTPEQTAEPMDGPTVAWLCQTARRFETALVCSVAIREADASGTLHYFNRLFFLRPDGTFQTYNKRHLFRMGGEQHHYTMGHEKCTIEYLGWRIRPLVCYDLRFPVFSRNEQDYDLLIYVASWPEARAHAWSALLCARAIENLAYVVGVNRVGSDPKNTYRGDSVVLDFKGLPLAEAIPGQEATLTSDLDLEALRAFRTQFPAHLDADRFTLDE